VVWGGGLWDIEMFVRGGGGGGGGVAKTWSLTGFSSSVGSFLGVGYTSAGVPL